MTIAAVFNGRSRLCPDTPVLVFKQPQLDELDNLLADREAATEVVPADVAEEMLLGSDGTTIRGGYRYTASGLLTVCRALAPGLSKLIFHLTGPTTAPAIQRVADLQAIGIFNKLLDLRFPAFQEKGVYIVKDTRHKTIEGFGLVHSGAFTNNEFLHRVQSSLSDVGSYTLQQAVIAGPKLTVRFRSETELFRASTPQGLVPYYHGLYGLNSGTWGTGIRLGRLLTSRYGGIMLSQKIIPRRGTNVTRRVNDGLQRSAAIDANPMELKGFLERLQTRSLNCGTDKETYLERKEQLIKELSKSIPIHVADDIVRRAVYIGSDFTAPTIDRLFYKEVAGQRTQFDLLCAITAVAFQMEAGHRERLERYAAKFLLQNPNRGTK